MSGSLGAGFYWFQQIPEVAIQIFEHGDSAVGFVFRLAHENNPLRFVVLIVSPEVVGVKKQEDATARLRADAGFLLGRGGAGEQQARLGCARWCDDHPTLALLR